MALVQVLLIRDFVPLCNGACIEFRPEGPSPPAGASSNLLSVCRGFDALAESQLGYHG
jgi:hypothetical protein